MKCHFFVGGGGGGAITTEIKYCARKIGEKNREKGGKFMQVPSNLGICIIGMFYRRESQSF